MRALDYFGVPTDAVPVPPPRWRVAAAALLALTRSRRPVGVALGLFAAVRALSALLGRAPSPGDPRYLVPPRQLGAAGRQAPLLVAEVAQHVDEQVLVAFALFAAAGAAARSKQRASSGWRRLLRAKLEPAEVYHQVLEHRWYLSQSRGGSVPLAEALGMAIQGDEVISKVREGFFP